MASRVQHKYEAAANTTYYIRRYLNLSSWLRPTVSMPGNTASPIQKFNIYATEEARI